MSNWPRVEVLFSKNLNTSPLELDQLSFYRVEDILTAYEEMIKEENKSQEGEQQKMQKEYQMPNYGGFQVPKIEIPKISMPK